MPADALARRTTAAALAAAGAPRRGEPVRARAARPRSAGALPRTPRGLGDDSPQRGRPRAPADRPDGLVPGWGRARVPLPPRALLPRPQRLGGGLLPPVRPPGEPRLRRAGAAARRPAGAPAGPGGRARRGPPV